MNRKVIDYSLCGINKVSQEVSRMLLKNRILLLHGDLGVGKTTFVKSIVECLGGNPQNVTSPTFNILHQYNIKKLKIFHFDLYRIESKKELINIGIEDAMMEGIMIIEWGEIIEHLLDQCYISVYMEFTANESKRSVLLEY